MRIAQGVHGVLVHGGLVIFQPRWTSNNGDIKDFLELVYLGVYWTGWGNLVAETLLQFHS